LTNKPEIKRGPWDGQSDHFLVTAETSKVAPTQLRVPPKLLRDQEKRAQAADFYKAELPARIQDIRNSRSGEDLEKATHALERVFLDPWLKNFSARPARFRPGWTHRLDAKAKKRTRLIKSGAKIHAPEIKALDREIKREFRRNIRGVQKRELARAADLPEDEAASAVIQLSKNFKLSERDALIPTLKPDDFSRHMAASQRQDAEIAAPYFQLPADFAEKLAIKLRTAKKRKAAGPDGVVSEMLNLAPGLVAEALTALWGKVGSLQFMPTLLRTASFSPIWKSGAKEDPANYRPIALLSVCRRVLSATLDAYIREAYTFHKRQWGFREAIGTGAAITHATGLLRKGRKKWPCSL